VETTAQRRTGNIDRTFRQTTFGPPSCWWVPWQGRHATEVGLDVSADDAIWATWCTRLARLRMKRSSSSVPTKRRDLAVGPVGQSAA